MMQRLKFHIKTAWRTLRSHSLSGSINIGSLAVAMSAVIMLFVWIQNELTYDRYHQNSESTYLVTNTETTSAGESMVTENSPFILAAIVQQQFAEAELTTGAFRTQQNEWVLHVDQQLFNQEWGLYVDSNWFRVFDYRFKEGSAAAFFSQPYSLAITQSKAKQLFGNQPAVGKIIDIDSMQYIVQAVLEDNPANSSFQFDVLMPVAAKLNTANKIADANYWGNLTYKLFIKLKNTTAPQKTAEKINKIYAANHERTKLEASLLPLKDLHFNNQFRWSAFEHGNLFTVQIFSMLAVLLLLIACINYINIAIAKINLRYKEMGIRKVLGASRGTIFLQLFTEAGMAALFALVITLLLLQLCQPILGPLSFGNASINLLSKNFLLIILITYASVLLLIGIYPPLLMMSLKPSNIFSGLVLGVKHSLMRKILLTGQFAMSVVAIVAAMVIYRQMHFIQTQEHAYDRSKVIALSIPPKDIQFDREKRRAVFKAPLKESLLSLPQVRHVSQTNIHSVIDLNYVIAGGLDWNGRPEDFNPSWVNFSADADLNKILHFQFVEGRWFSTGNHADEDNVILNETAVKNFGISQPVVGKRFNNGVIVGVVKDFYYKSMHHIIEPVVIKLQPGGVVNLLVEIETADPAPAIAAIQEKWNAILPGRPFVYSFLDEQFEQLYRADRQALQFTTAMSVLCILLSCIGLLGMVMMAVNRRKKEIAIRKVLGISRAGIMALISKEYLRLLLIAICIASPVAALLMQNWLQAFAYKVSLDGWVFGAAAVMTLLLSMLTISMLLFKALSTNPAQHLRSE